MKALQPTPSLAEQVHQAILSAIASGKLSPGARIIQDQIAQDLGVSRQPVQQALTLLRKQGVLHDAPGRGLIVAPLDLVMVQHMAEVRAALESLAAGKAAEIGAARARSEGAAYLRTGRRAMAKKSVSDMVAADVAFHNFIYQLSGNALIAPAMEVHWTHTQRVIGEVLSQEPKPGDIWQQHEALLDAIMAGNRKQAEKLAREHVLGTTAFMIGQLRSAG